MQNMPLKMMIADKISKKAHYAQLKLRYIGSMPTKVTTLVLTFKGLQTFSDSKSLSTPVFDFQRS